VDKLAQKRIQLIQAISTLEKALDNFAFLVNEKISYNPHMDYAEEYRTHRDSVIQRFEYTIDLFWKYLKKYLESVHVLSGIKIPGEVIRTACSLEIIKENEAEQILAMIKSRNITSHIYVEEIAEQIIATIPKYCQTIKAVMSKL
jgi:nucleotidyltransferase substrate binding protein (TIGR01987 family)